MKDPYIPTPNIHPTALVAPGAVVYGDVEIRADTFVLFGAIIRAELDRVRIGSGTNIQDNAVVHCDEDLPSIIGDRVTIGHSAVVHGAAVGDNCLVGIGARALNGSELGEGSWLAAGSVLPEGRAIPPWTLGVGIPAHPVRELTQSEIARASDGVDHYLALLAAYREIFSNEARL